MRNIFKSLVLGGALLMTASLVQAQQKIGHINYAEIFTATDEYKKAEVQLTALDSVKTTELQAMIAVYQQKQTDAQELLRNRSEANKDETDTKVQSLGIELQEIERRVQESQRLAEEEMNKRQQELFTPIHQKVGVAIQAVAKEKSYAYVFDISSTNIPYYDGGDDLSGDIKTKLGIK